MVNHLVGHAAINADVLACDEACFIGTEEQYHVGNVHRIAHTPNRLLRGIGTFMDSVAGVNPARRYGIDAYLSRKAYSQCVCEGGNASFCSSVAFCLRLAHTIS